MAKRTMQNISFSQAKIMCVIYDILSITGVILALLYSLNWVISNKNYMIFINTIVIILIFIFGILKDNKLKASEEIRRSLLISNSFEVKTPEKKTKGYYNNNEINNGYKRLLANVCENSFFSKKIISKMIFSWKSMLPILSLASLIIYCATVGFANISLSIPILQIFLSGLLIERIVKKCSYLSCVKKIHEGSLMLLDINLKEDDSLTAKIILLLLKYETNISESKIILDEKIYNKLNPKLTKEWNDLKNRLNIK